MAHIVEVYSVCSQEDKSDTKSEPLLGSREASILCKTILCSSLDNLGIPLFFQSIKSRSLHRPSEVVVNATLLVNPERHEEHLFLSVLQTPQLVIVH